MTIDVSVIVPTFRRPRRLRETLESVRRQRGVGFEIIVIDDSPEGSTAKDGSGNHPEVEMASGRMEPFAEASADRVEGERRVFSDAARRAASRNKFGPKWGFTGRMIVDKAMFVCGAAIVRREGVIDVGGFGPRVRLREVVDFFARVIRRFGAHDLDRVSPGYRVGALSPMHAPVLTDADIRHHENGRRPTQAKFRWEHGSLEYFAMKVFTRTVLRLP